ncbi:MAG: hypothetical protein A4E67_00415 [Syntrophaceae bacterium PtaB.Bin038]|nr:MAG: hypothetical protein A4E67_00415 [Syntrophaceae bacterium PtaB.Bin038]
MPPMITPWSMKIFMMLFDVAPMDFRIAMSLVFSMTTMMSVQMMLKPATSTMRPTMMNMTRFSRRRAAKRLRFIFIQSLAQAG